MKVSSWQMANITKKIIATYKRAIQKTGRPLAQSALAGLC